MAKLTTDILGIRPISNHQSKARKARHCIPACKCKARQAIPACKVQTSCPSMPSKKVIVLIQPFHVGECPSSYTQLTLAPTSHLGLGCHTIETN